MKKIEIIAKAVFVCGAAFFLAACAKEATINEKYRPAGTEIMFSASTSYVNGEDTRTEYSGELFGSTNRYERIDWLSDDVVAISYVHGSETTASDYVVTEVNASSDKNSVASVEVVSGQQKLTWGEGEGDHVFYALYPATGFKGNSSVSLTNNNHVSGFIPALQEIHVKEGKYLPPMEYAYLAAYKHISGSSHENRVTLPFTPAVTAFEFQLQRKAGEANVTVTSAELSATTPLTGTFAFDITGGDENGAIWDKSIGTGATTLTGTGNSVTITFPTGGVSVPAYGGTEYLDFTFLALPVEQTGVKIKLNYSDGSSRTLSLNDAPATPHVFAAARKHIIRNRAVEGGDWEYIIGNLSPITVEYYGGTGTLASGFTSYRTDGSNSQAVPFVLEYSPNGVEWSTSCDWITPSGVNLNGSTTGQNFNAVVAPQANTGSDPHRTALAAATPKNNFDLSTKNVATGATVARTTANCYVVDAPGTYRFPLVYGNAIVNNGLNQLAFRGNLHETSGYWFRYGYADRDGYSGFEYHLGTFRDHRNELITQAMHNGQASANDVYIALKYSNLNAILVWEDSPGLIQVDGAISGSGSDAYITFNVPQATITEGNALIAVRSGSTILWSWHIWVTDRNLAAGITGPTGYVFSPANVGWCDGKSLIFEQRQYYVRARQPESGKISNVVLVKENPYQLTVKGNNPYYQWGRKDPMQAGDGRGVGSDGSQIFKHYYTYPDLDPYRVNYAPQHGVRGPADLGTGIQNPHVEYNTEHSYPYDWANIIYTNADGNGGDNQRHTAVNLWNSAIQRSSYQSNVNYRNEANNTKVTKTIYDPSPVGYKVPNIAALEGFTAGNTSWTTVNGDVGRLYGGNLFFPAVGGYSGGVSTQGVTVAGSYFAASESFNDGSCDVMEFTSNYVHTGYDNGSFWYSFKLNCWCIRPIRE